MTPRAETPLTALSAAWEALRQAIWENAPSYDPHDFIQDHRPAIEAAVLAARSAPEPAEGLRTALDRFEAALQATEGIPLGLFGLWEQARVALSSQPEPANRYPGYMVGDPDTTTTGPGGMPRDFSAERAVSEGLLDAAWAEAEAAAHARGWEIVMFWRTLQEPWGVHAAPFPTKTDSPGEYAGGDTPAAALRALTERLTASREPA